MKVMFVLDGDWKLLVVTQASYVGVLPHGEEVYCVDKIGILPLTSSCLAPDIIGLGVSISKMRPSLNLQNQ